MSNDFVIGVVSSLVASVLIYIAGFIFVRFRYRVDLLKLWSYFRLLRRMRSAGIADVFPSREDIEKYRKEPKKSGYIRTVETSFTYIGLFFPIDDDWDKVQDSLEEILLKECQVEIIFWSPDIESILEKSMASYYLIRFEYLRGEIQKSWNHLLDFKNKLPDVMQERLLLKTHQEPITDSVFMLDHATAHGRIFLDMKLYALGKESSLAIELEHRTANHSLYKRVARSFDTIRRHAIDFEPKDLPK